MINAAWETCQKGQSIIPSPEECQENEKIEDAVRVSSQIQDQDRASDRRSPTIYQEKEKFSYI